MGVLPLLGYWRDELGSPELSKALHVLAIISEVPTPYLVIAFLIVLLLMTVEGTFRNTINERAEFDQEAQSLRQKTVALEQSLNDALVKLEAPKLEIEIIDFQAEEIPGPPNPLKDANILFFSGMSNDEVKIKLRIRISNANRVETAIRPGSLSLAVYDSSPQHGKHGVLTATEAPLSGTVKFAQPVEGWVEFKLENCTAMSVVRNTMTVSAVDGNGQKIISSTRLLGWIKQPEH